MSVRGREREREIKRKRHQKTETESQRKRENERQREKERGGFIISTLIGACPLLISPLLCKRSLSARYGEKKHKRGLHPNTQQPHERKALKRKTMREDEESQPGCLTLEFKRPKYKAVKRALMQEFIQNSLT